MPERSAGVLAAALLVAACSEETGLVQRSAELRVETTTLDFEAVPIGATRRLAVVITNAGNVALQVEDVAISGAFDAGSEVERVAPGERVELDLAFSPVREDPEEGELRLTTDAGSAVVRLLGRGAASLVVAQPPEVDLGRLEIGQRASAEVVFEHIGPVDVSGRWVVEGLARAEYFSATGLGPFIGLGEASFSPRDRFVTEIEYAPLREGEDAGLLRFEFCGPRCGAEVRLQGAAGASVLTFDPPALTFDGVAIGGRETRQVVLRNIGDEPVVISSLETRGDPEFTVEADAVPPFEIGPGALVGVRVRFAPVDAGARQGRIVMGLGGQRFETREVPLRGEGTGPRVTVSPPEISFGLSADVSPIRQPLVISNAGSSFVEITGVSLEGDPAFALSVASPPLALGSGESVFASVEFAPQDLGTYTATVTVDASDGTRFVVPVRGAIGEAFCELRVSPSVLNFGVTREGRQRVENLRLSNDGQQACALDLGIQGRSSPFAFASAPPTALQAGTSTQVAVRFSPASRAEFKDVLSVRTDDPISGIRRVSLVGNSAGLTDLIVLPEIVAFGPTRLDCPAASRAIRLINVGSRTLQVENVDWAQARPELSLGGPASQTLLGGAEAVWSVRFAPVEPRSVEGVLRFDIRGIEYPLYVPVFGRGAETPRREDRFQQSATLERDILFVIDDSCSMADDQQALADNTQLFIEQADLRGVEYRIGVTTTTVIRASGSLQGPVIDSAVLSDAEVARRFGDQARVGISGSGFEQGLEAMLQALERAERGAGFNRELLREDASLAIVIVTDEDDSSPGPAAFYFSQLERFSDLPVLTAVVSGGRLGCATALPAPKYQDFLDFTQGQAISICGDWGQNLRSLGQIAFGLPRDFQLSAPVDPSFSVDVTIDGAPAFGWTLEGEVLSFPEPPPEGSEIVVQYVPACP